MTFEFDCTPSYVKIGDFDTRNRYLRLRQLASSIALANGPSWGASFGPGQSDPIRSAWGVRMPYASGTVTFQAGSGNRNVDISGGSWADAGVSVGNVIVSSSPDSGFFFSCVIVSVVSETRIVVTWPLGSTTARENRPYYLYYWYQNISGDAPPLDASFVDL